MPGIADYVAAVLADSPVAFWKLDEASGLPQDSSGFGRHMTASSGSPSYSQAGPFAGASAIRFAGGAGFTRAQVSTKTNDFTYEAWLNLEAVTAANQGVFLNQAASQGWALLAQTSFAIQALAQGVAFLTASSPLTASTWYHVVVVRRAGTWVYYLNAVDTGSKGTTSPNGAPTQTGIHTGSSVQALHSLVAYYDSALSDVRIAAHYAAAGFTPPSGGAARLSQEPTEAFYTPIPAARLSQQPVEVISTPLSGAVIEQLPVEIIAANIAPPPQLSYWKLGTLDAPALGERGLQTISGLGARPKALVFFGANWTAEDVVDTGSGTAVFRGMAAPKWDDPSTIVQDAAAHGPGDQHREAACAILNLTRAGDATILYQANVTGFTADGFTLDWLVGAAGYRIVYAALFDVDHVGAYRGVSATTLAGVGWKAGAALVQGAWAGPDISGNNRSQEWYGGAAYPTDAQGNWMSAGMSCQCFPTSQSQQMQVYLDAFPPHIQVVSAQHFTGPFLTGSLIKAYPTNPDSTTGELQDFVFTGDGTNGGIAMFWDDPDSKTGYATPDAVAGNVVSVSLPFDPGLVMGYSVSNEPRAQGTGGRGAAGFSVIGFDKDGGPFQWGCLVDRINPGAIQSFAKIPNVVADTAVESFSGELVAGGFELTTVDTAAPAVSWLWHAFGHPFPPPAEGLWLPQIYRRVRSY